MKSTELVNDILSKSNFIDVQAEIDNFTEHYIKKLLENVLLYVDSSICLMDITVTDSYTCEPELSQEIIGVPSAYSAMMGDPAVLSAFAENYSRLGIAEFDNLCREALLDFLNVHNGLFIVELSQNNICELSLRVPKQSGLHQLSTKDIEGNITIIPIKFKFGVITFILCTKFSS